MMNTESVNERQEERENRREQRQARRISKRKVLENRFSTVTLLIFVPVFFLIALFLLVFPRTEESLIEKRELAKFPEFSPQAYFAGEFTSGITTFYDDTVPYRDSFKNMGNQMKSIFGIRSDSSVTFVNNPTPVGKKDKDKNSAVKDADIGGIACRVAPKPTEEPDQKDYTGEEADGNYDNGILIVKQDGHSRALELFGGGSGTTYAQALNDLQKKVGDGVQIYSMPAPLASEFYVPSNYSDLTSSQSDCFDRVAGKLDSPIKSINICPVLSKHTEEPIYLRTDHHWQPLGAYYAARTFAEEAGVPFAELSTYEKKVSEGFVGTMYAFSGSADLLNDPDDFTYYLPSNEYKTYYYDTDFSYKYSDDLFVEVDLENSYLMFMGGDSQVVKIDTDVKNGRRLLVVKDSYGNAEIPFYTGSFEQIYVVDMRYFQRNLVNFIRNMNVTDVLFTMSSYSVVGENADNLPNLITQDADSTLVDEQLSQKETGESGEDGAGDAENS